MPSAELVIETTEGALDQLLEAMDEDAANGPETDLVNDDNDGDEDSDEGDNKDNEGETPDNEEKAHDTKRFERISKMYIKAETRSGYNTLNRTFLLWLDDKHPDCLSQIAKTTLQETYKSQHSAKVKHKNKAVMAKALELVANATDVASSPIDFTKITARIFVDFLHFRARLKSCNFLSKSGCGGYRSALRELHRQCGVTVNPTLETQLTEKFKGLLRGYTEEKQEKGGRLTEGMFYW